MDGRILLRGDLQHAQAPARHGVDPVGGGMDDPPVTKGSAAMGGADVLTDGGGGGIGEKGDDG